MNKDLLRRDEKIEIQARSGSETSFGTIPNTWTTTLTRWAHVKGLRGMETNSEGVPAYAGTYQFTMAKPTAITPNQRILWKARAFNITGIDDSDKACVIVTAVDGQQGEA